MASTTPTIIAGRYELQRRLATGGMAEVWLAMDLTLDRKVAVKWLKPTLATDEIVAERFRREAIAAASLNHPNIVAVHDVFEQDGRQAVVMQLVDGKSLRQLLDTQKRLSPELTCHIGIAVALALDDAHAAGFVHRDVKPGNIMITPDGRVLLTDFGIAKGLHGDGNDDLTNDNIMMGTAKYLSPEQVRGKKLDGRADLYSLGLVLYECLAGRVPFLGETDADTALARLQRDPTDLSRLRATLPVRLVGVIHALLARKPENRPATGADLIVELNAARAEGAPPYDPSAAEPSPIAPFAAGKLVRAPSDVRGRMTDRNRIIRQHTPPHGRSMGEREPRQSSPKLRRGAATEAEGAPIADNPVITGPVGIPGEPIHITGRTPLHEAPPSPTPSTRVATVRADAPPPIHRDPTPPTGAPRAATARGLSDKRFSPSTIFIAGLITIAAVLGLIIYLSLQFAARDTAPSTTDLPPRSTPSATEPTPNTVATEGADVEPAVPTEPAAVASIIAFDPEGNGEENDALADNAIDGDSDTAWLTQCYSEGSLQEKSGVGLIASFDTPTNQQVTVEFTNGPIRVGYYASSETEPPDNFADWGDPFVEEAHDDATSAVVRLPADTRHVLVSFRRLGRDTTSTCSEDFGNVGGIAELALMP